MNKAQEILIGKTIKNARITGFDVEIEFTDGSTFEYDASDGGYSTWDLTDTDGRSAWDLVEEDGDTE